MSRAQTLIELLRLDYDLTDQAIASRCGVSRVHINYVLHGKRQASVKLENALETLLAEYDRGELTRKPGEGKDVRTTGHPPKKPVTPPERPSPSRDLPRAESKRTSGIVHSASKQVSNKPAPTPFVPSPVQAIPGSAFCVACRRPGVRTALYGGKRLCEWCAAARGYRVKTPKASFVPLPTQHMPGERVSPPENTQAEPTPETPPLDPSTWVFPRPGFGRDYQDYQRGMFCLACHAHTPTRQVRIANFTRARSVRLCEPCCKRYEV